MAREPVVCRRARSRLAQERNRDRRLAQQLLNRGAIVNARDDSGTTALMLAARRSKTDLVKLLLSKGAYPTVKNCHGDDAAAVAKFGGSRR